jgi:acyl-CoA synthetase (NDP forming)
VINDSNFGPVLACRSGGALGELAGDVALRLTPLSALDAHELPRALRSFPLLEGNRGAPACDIASLEQLLLRISAMVEQHQEIVELACDPIYVRASGTTIARARVRVELAPTPSLSPSLAGR